MSVICKLCPWNHGVLCDQNPATCPFDDWGEAGEIGSEKGEAK